MGSPAGIAMIPNQTRRVNAGAGCGRPPAVALTQDAAPSSPQTECLLFASPRTVGNDPEVPPSTATSPAPVTPLSVDVDRDVEPDVERDARRDSARRWNPPRFDPPNPADFNRLALDFRKEAAGMLRPPVRGTVIDCHTHLLSAAHADAWFDAALAYGIEHTVTMTPLEEAIRLANSPWGERTTLIAVPAWQPGGYDPDNFWPRVDGYHNLGCRVVKFHLAPQTMVKTGLVLGGERLRRYVGHAIDRGMIIMTHIGDPQSWYDHAQRYGGDAEFFGSRDAHYDAWEILLDETRGHPWWGAHLGGWPENLPRLQHLLDTYPDLMLDLSATKWIVRALSEQRDEARRFIIRNADRLMWGSDQVSLEGRGFDFYASRWWTHRMLWETARQGESPIADPDAVDGIPMLRGLSLPTDVLQRLYHDNVRRFLTRAGVTLPD